MMHQYMTSISPNSRPQQQSSPSDNQSMSTATPPHQTISRASPASTALVMSSNNINAQQQASSRQLTPNTSSSQNGTGSSSNSSSNGQQSGVPPNPMVRQFACHTKSMSAGVVVSVPGITNTINGLNPNNLINNNMVPHHRQQHINSDQNANHHRVQQQVIKEHHQRNHHQHLASGLHHQQQQQHQQAQQYTHTNHSSGQIGSSNNCINSRNQATSSSIILSNNNINDLHNRSASAHLSSVLLASHQQNGNSNSVSNHHLNANSRNYNPHAVTNSIWSIDENISKSQGKLASNFHPSFLFSHSITDMSCDNVSNVSQLLDGQPTGPAPAYYSIHPPKPPPPVVHKSPEFLSICDLMFYLISMIIYFCENTFGIIALIALYYHTAFYQWSLIGTAFVISSNFVCQYISFKWLYQVKLEECRRKQEAEDELEDEEGCKRRYYNRNVRDYRCGSCTWLPDRATELHFKFLFSIALDAIMHILCLGFLVRYIKLVIPVDDSKVKRQARDLCLLRMIHGFVQSAPLLLIQAYMIYSQAFISSPVTSLSVTSAILSLINVCWALASFTKYARKKYMHRFDITWHGVLSQLLWRLGTVSSRVVALTIYAVYYGYWMLIILALHWLTMFFWLIKPKNLLRDEVDLPPTKKVSYAAAAAWIYCFCFVNFEEHNSKVKMTSFYLIMFLENNLLLTVCLIFSPQVTWFKNLSILVVYLGYVVGMIFMFLYYKYYHVNILNNELSCSRESVDSIADQLSPPAQKIAGFKPGTLRLKSEEGLAPGHRYNSNISSINHTGSHPEITRNNKPPYLTHNQPHIQQSGVFNCKMNTVSNKQKKTHIRRQVT